jgi:tRNA dimethylallyltransferase
MQKHTDPKAIAVIGPTASGKSDLAIFLAKKFDGEVISADSRQIYKGMDLGTGKVPRDKRRGRVNEHDKAFNTYYSDGVAHYMLDIISPKSDYNVAKFIKTATKHLEDILSRGKLPILCGGTLFWAQALVENMKIDAVPPNKALRKKLATKDTKELYLLLKSLAPEKAKSIDRYNPVRLIRAIEIAKAPKKRKQESAADTKRREFLSSLDWLVVALAPEREKLNKRIKARINSRLRDGMLEEVERLHDKEKVSWNKLESFGLEYRRCTQFLTGELNNRDFKERLYFDIIHYAKRQETWMRKWNKSREFIIFEKKSDATKIVKNFL